MPTIINAESGQAESLPEEQSSSALAAGTHHVPLYSPAGEAVAVPQEQAAELMSQGYSQPTAEENQAMLEKQHYESPHELAKTAAQGVASGLTFGASNAILKAQGADEASIQKRAEINPGVLGLGEVAGFGALTMGASALAAPAAEATTALGRVGSIAAKSGIDNMLFESGHEAAKYFAGNPDSIETAAADIGLAGLLGGGLGAGFGGATELWKLGPGAKIAEALNAVKNRAANVEHAVEVPESLQAMVNGDNWAAKTVQVMNESDTVAGRAVQKDVEKLYTNLNEGVAESVGKSAKDIEGLAARRESEIGEVAKESLEKRIRAEYEPIAKKYNDFDSSFSKVPISSETSAQLQNTIADIATAEGYIKAPSSAQMKLITNVLKEIPLQENAADLANYVKNMTYNPETWPAQKLIKQAIEEAKNGAIESHLKVSAPTVLEDFRITQQEYKAMKQTVEQLNDRLRTGKQRGVESFLKNVNESTPEDILHALSAKGDANYQKLLQDKFPELAALSKDQELIKLLKKAPGKGDQILDGKKLIKLINELPIESREFLINADGLKRLNDIGELYEKIPKSMNPSGTAKTLHALDKGFGSSALGVAVATMSHSGLMGMLAVLGKAGLREGGDAARLAVMKFLGSAERTSAEGFVAAAKLADATIKGEQKLNNSVGSVFTKGADVIEFPDAKARDVLKKAVEESLKDPEKLLNSGGATGHYLPGHGAAIGAAAARNLGYLATLRPNITPLGPLDKVRVASKDEEAKYNNALNIAAQPLIVVNAIKNGTLTLQDIQHIKTMYPELSNRISEKLTAELIKHKSEGGEVAYKTKIALSTWAHQPLDSSVSQQSIMANQMTYMAMPAPGAPAGKGTPAKASASLNKIGSSFMTPQQSRVNYKTTGHR